MGVGWHRGLHEGPALGRGTEMNSSGDVKQPNPRPHTRAIRRGRPAEGAKRLLSRVPGSHAPDRGARTNLRKWGDGRGGNAGEQRQRREEAGRSN